MNQDYVVGVYLRISSEDVKVSDCDSNSIASQRERIKDYILNHKELKKASLKEYVDDGISGTNFEREAVSTLIEDAKHGLINCVIVKDFSRFGRNYIETGTYIDKIFPFLGIRFISVNDNYDSGKSSSHTGGIDVAFKNMIHDFYSKDLSKKIISAKRGNAEKGKHMTAYAPYGFVKNKDKKLVADIESADVVRRIFTMRLNGKTQTEIARILNKEGIPSPLMLRKKRNDKFPCNKSNDITYWRGSRIQAILKDRRYVGDAVYGKYKRAEIGSKKDIKVPESEWIVVENAHEGIISRKDFEKVQGMFRHYSKGRKKNMELFTSKIKCADCNHTLITKVYNNKSGKIVRYVCNTKSSVSVYKCINKQIDEMIIAKVILTMLQKFSLLVDDVSQVNQGRKDSIQEYEKDIKGYKITLKMLQNKKFDNYKAYKAGSISLEVFKKEKSEYEKRESEIKDQIDDLDKKMKLLQSNMEDSENTIKDFTRLCPFNKLTREMVDIFIDHIEIDHMGKMAVVWNFEDIF
ncbi:MAG: recombinase family protein [Anaeromicrobium sp.]|jgi:DNA invertase Pin-like site-specific DNA recombinase|uniref:recombinase family protein n=1 Tax=Anaeromicrobium sp. TaxID=1929132 RepID=UPI0025E13FF9|nr:recombinase family protein [Anaeromicrobium sp.]MCT4596148.1 recombinase family protein [Anaeromicrobium sp.]